jgi:hypothetical protein
MILLTQFSTDVAKCGNKNNITTRVCLKDSKSGGLQFYRVIKKEVYFLKNVFYKYY